jgi:hypothetical protein
MIIGMYDGVIALFSAQNLNGSVGDDFIGVHVGGSSGPALDCVYDKLVEELACDDLVTSLQDSFSDFFVQHIGGHIGHGSGLFDPG